MIDRSSDRILVLSSDMAETERRRGVDPARLRIVRNFDPWDDPNDQAPVSPPLSNMTPIRVVFAGNLGNYQGLDAVIAAAGVLRGAGGLTFEIFGEGPRRAELEAEARHRGLQNVTFHGHLLPAALADYLRSARAIGLVPLHPGVIRAACPSKAAFYLRHSCPVVAMVEPDTELARILSESGAGIQVDPASAQQLAAALMRLAREPGALATMQSAALETYNAMYTKEVLLPEWKAALTSLRGDRLR